MAIEALDFGEATTHLHGAEDKYVAAGVVDLAGWAAWDLIKKPKASARPLPSRTLSLCLRRTAGPSKAAGRAAGVGQGACTGWRVGIARASGEPGRARQSTPQALATYHKPVQAGDPSAMGEARAESACGWR